MSHTTYAATRRAMLASAAVGLAGVAAPLRAQATQQLLNVSFDPTRELYHDINDGFAEQYLLAAKRTVVVRTSNGGSGAQARAVLDGQEADVVTLALAADIDALQQRGLIAENWQTRLPWNSTPWTSTIVFLTRKGNPKGVRDWGDLVRSRLAVITPNPKTSGGARWNYLAAWGWAQHQPGGNDARAEDYLRALFKQVPVLDTGARGATNSFVQRGLGDVLLAWEAEALLAARDLGPDKFDVIYPPESILAEPPVSLVDRVVDRRGTRAVATAYLEYLFSDAGQSIGAKHFFRPHDLARAPDGVFRPIKTFDIASLGGWAHVQSRHFAYGGVFDRISTEKQ